MGTWLHCAFSLPTIFHAAQAFTSYIAQLSLRQDLGARQTPQAPNSLHPARMRGKSCGRPRQGYVVQQLAHDTSRAV